MKSKFLYTASETTSAQRTVVVRRGLAIALVAMTAMLAACSSEAGHEAQTARATSANVTLTTAQRQNIRIYTVAASKFRKTIDTTGVVDFDNDQATSVLAPFSGPVSRLLVAPGTLVKKGEALALVDSPDFAAAIGAYRKALATAHTARQVADSDQDLVQHNGVSQREAQQAQTDAVNAEADRDAALQALIALQVDPQAIKDLQQRRPVVHAGGVIRSPIAGTVVEKLITPGQLLQAGTTPCFTVADLSRVWVFAQIFGANLAAVAVGDSAEVQPGIESKSFAGKVDNIAALVDPVTRSVAARVVVENPGDFLKKQMYVHVLIRSQQDSEGLLVPVSAILRDDENLPFVYVVQSDGSFAREHVGVGYRDGDRYEIAEGLHAGDQVVVDGAIFVQFMQAQ